MSAATAIVVRGLLDLLKEAGIECRLDQHGGCEVALGWRIAQGEAVLCEICRARAALSEARS